MRAMLLSVPSLVRMVSLGCCVVTVTLLPSLDPRSVSRSRHSTKWGPCFCLSPPSSEWSVWVAVLWPSPSPYLYIQDLSANQSTQQSGAVLLSVPSFIRMVNLGCCVVTITLPPSLDQDLSANQGTQQNGGHASVCPLLHQNGQFGLLCCDHHLALIFISKICQQIKALNRMGAMLLSVPSFIRMFSLGCCVVTITLPPSLYPRSVSKSKHSTEWGPCFCLSPPSSEWSVWAVVLWPSPSPYLYIQDLSANQSTQQNGGHASVCPLLHQNVQFGLLCCDHHLAPIFRSKISQQIKALDRMGAMLLSIPSLIRMVSLGRCITL